MGGESATGRRGEREVRPEQVAEVISELSNVPVERLLQSDGERLLARKVDRDVRDAWLIATAQRIEHLEIASYGTVRTFAETMGYTLAAQLLQQTLEEERATDEKLTHLAERFVNPQSIRPSAQH